PVFVRLLDPLFPAPAADLLARRVAELLLVGLAMPEGMVRKLQMRAEPTVEVEARAEAGSQRDHHLHALAGDDGETLQVGIVGDADRLAERSLQRLGQVEALPRVVAEVGGRE